MKAKRRSTVGPGAECASPPYVPATNVSFVEITGCAGQHMLRSPFRSRGRPSAARGGFLLAISTVVPCAGVGDDGEVVSTPVGARPERGLFERLSAGGPSRARFPIFGSRRQRACRLPPRSQDREVRAHALRICRISSRSRDVSAHGQFPRRSLGNTRRPSGQGAIPASRMAAGSSCVVRPSAGAAALVAEAIWPQRGRLAAPLARATHQSPALTRFDAPTPRRARSCAQRLGSAASSPVGADDLGVPWTSRAAPRRSPDRGWTTTDGDPTPPMSFSTGAPSRPARSRCDPLHHRSFSPPVIRGGGGRRRRQRSGRPRHASRPSCCRRQAMPPPRVSAQHHEGQDRLASSRAGLLRSHRPADREYGRQAAPAPRWMPITVSARELRKPLVLWNVRTRATAISPAAARTAGASPSMTGPRGEGNRDRVERRRLAVAFGPSGWDRLRPDRERYPPAPRLLRNRPHILDRSTAAGEPVRAGPGRLNRVRASEAAADAPAEYARCARDENTASQQHAVREQLHARPLPRNASATR